MGDIMKKWETFSEEELKKIVQESTSFREIGIKCGYSPISNASKPGKEIVNKYNFDISHFYINKNKNYIGRKFYYLTAIGPTNERSKSGLVLWEFKCDCGKICKKPISYVINGNTKSCGCKKSSGLVKYNLEQSEQNKIKIGTVFGKLTVIEDLGFKNYYNNNKRRRAYKCRCECGNIIEVFGNNLKFGEVTSCGCLNSKGEEKIIQILINNNIKFSHDISIKKLNKQLNRKFRFDFILYDQNDNIERVIEFDGKQHNYGMTGGNWKEIISLDEIKERDKIKNIFCIENNITLIRIPYYKLSTLCLEDLLSDKYKVLEVM